MRKIESRTLVCLLLLWSCCEPSSSNDVEGTHFKMVSLAKSGISFRNDIVETENFNAYTYPYTYNGGGVAVGDFNSDGLPDIVLISNQQGPLLYRNNGDLNFTDISKSSGIRSDTLGWFTGVSIADVNGDGREDIYVCKSGPRGPYRRNLLFINNGNLTFTEQARVFGLDNPQPSTHANFIDLDLDGDLDVYIANHPDDLEGIVYQMSAFSDSALYANGHDQILINEGGFFRDKTTEMGVTDRFGFGLSVAASDINSDGYPDLFVANDFASPDVLYMNESGGALKNSTTEYLTTCSHFSMGTDWADIDGNGHLDLMVVDMLPFTHYRLKSNFMPMPIDYFKQLRALFTPPQYVKNSVYLNQGRRPFTESAFSLGLAATDWSWSPLLADFDNDGNVDCFVTNGIKRDHFDLDIVFANYDPTKSGRRPSARTTYDQMPTTLLQNRFFLNKGHEGFSEMSETSGIGHAVNSNGAAYADFDRDGDLDIIINNTDTFAFLYENLNNRASGTHHWCAFKMTHGSKQNVAIGVKVTLHYQGKISVRENYPSRGFQSYSQSSLHFGLGSVCAIDSVEITWHGGRTVINGLNNVDRFFNINLDTLKFEPIPIKQTAPLFKEMLGLEINPKTTVANPGRVFKQERLAFIGSVPAPVLTTGLLNQDSREDLVVGGSNVSPARVYIQQTDGRFKEIKGPWLDDHRTDCHSAVLANDFNGDGMNDILFCISNDDRWADSRGVRLFLNMGGGRFAEDSLLLPAVHHNLASACWWRDPFDDMGYLFLGGGVLPGSFPLGNPSYLVRIPSLGEAFNHKVFKGKNGTWPLISSALFTDTDGDNRPEVVLTGPFIPVMRFRVNSAAPFRCDTIFNQTGLWSGITALDRKGNGFSDILLGNIGTNTYLSFSTAAPLEYANGDFDGNGSFETVVSHLINKERGIFHDRNSYCEQMPSFWKKFHTFKQYASGSLIMLDTLIIPKARLTGSVSESHSGILKNSGDGYFTFNAFQELSALAPINGYIIKDVDDDGIADLIALPNRDDLHYWYDRAGVDGPVILLGQKNGNFLISPHQDEVLTGHRGPMAGVFLVGPTGGESLLIVNRGGNVRNYSLLHESVAK